MGLITNQNFDDANANISKEPILVLAIEGVPYVFASAQVYTTLNYDDPGVFYDGVWHYDDLRPLNSGEQKSLIMRKESTSTISQKLEQWDGRSSVQTMNIKLVDANQIVTRLITPGQVVPEIINRKVRVYFGYRNISFPQDYIRIFTGYINQVDAQQGAINFSFTDPSSKRKTQLFNSVTTKLSASMDNIQTTVQMINNAGLYRTILNAKGENDDTVTIGFIIDDEIMTYTNADVIDDQNMSGIVRGAFGTIAASHDVDAEVTPFIRFNDNAINILLKLNLSGWNDYWKTDIGLRAINNLDSFGSIPDTITFEQGVDVVRDYGLNIGDFIRLRNSTIPTNNDVFTIKDFLQDNRTVLVEEAGVLTQENPPLSGDLSTVADFRSKYDTYPLQAGLGLTPDDVLVSRHEYFRNTFLQINFDLRAKGEETSGKEYCEKHILKPLGGYSLTQGSRLSMGLTHPPLVSDLSKNLSSENVVEPKNIVVKRGLNTRFFYNEVLFLYDYDVLKDDFNRQIRFIDADAQDRMNQVSVLQIEVRGLYDSLATQQILSQRAQRILLRYRYSAETIDLKTQFSVGNTLDAGDIVVLTDNPDKPILQIVNTETGERGVVNRIMEVQERSINISNGTCDFSLLSNNGFAFSDRYGVVSGSSQVQTSALNTPSQFLIGDSFGAKFPGQEWKKWIDYQGSRVEIKNITFTQVGVSKFTLDAGNPNLVLLDTPLSFTPTSSYYMTFAPYDESSASSDALVKATFDSFDSTAPIVSGASNNVFTLQSGYASRYMAGQIIYVMSPDGSFFSPDVRIISIVMDTVTVGPIYTNGSNPDLGFTPASGYLMQLAGFLDSGSGYRLI